MPASPLIASPFVANPFIDWVFSCLLVALRVSPVFAMAPPFTLTQVPVLFRVLFGVGIAACLVSANPAVATITDLSVYNLVVVSARELMLGSIFVLAFQLTFGALYVAGRTIDIQAGFGLALLIDPTTNSQTPLIGTLFAYAAAAVFFAMDGHVEVVRILGASLQAIPLGTGHLPVTLAGLTSFPVRRVNRAGAQLGRRRTPLPRPIFLAKSERRAA